MTANSLAPARRILREPEVKALTGLSRTTRWKLAKEGKFPRALALSARARGYDASDIESWIESRRRERDGGGAA
jgi:prophage regulatory protein